MKDFSLESLAKDWEMTFIELMESKKNHPIVPYQPSRRYKNVKSNLVKLNIAAGPNVFPYDWINIDNSDFSQYFNFVQTITHSNGMPDHQKQLWEFCQNGGKIDFRQHDMTKPFTQFENNSADIIYVGQAIEHLNPIHQAPAFLNECFRMLKPGGTIRLTTPDLEILIEAYINNKMDQFTGDQPEFYAAVDSGMKLALLLFGASGENCNQIHYEGHMCCYTKFSMKRVLEFAGFSNITFYNKSADSNNATIRNEVRDEGVSHSIIVEGTK